MSLLGKEIKIQREARGLSQEKLGALIGITGQGLYNIEAGLTRLQPEMVGVTAKALRIRQEKLIDLAFVDYQHNFIQRMKN